MFLFLSRALGALTMSASTTCPCPLRLRSNKANKMPMTHIAPPPAKSAGSMLSIVCKRNYGVKEELTGEQVQWRVGCAAFGTEHSEYTTQG